MVREHDGRWKRWSGLLSRSPDFARFWTGETVSAIGSQITVLALPLLAVEELDATAGQMGLLGAAQTAPFLFFALLAGAWVDRRRKRPVLVAANVARAVLLSLIPVLALLGVLTLTQLLVIAFAAGSCHVLFEVAYHSYVPRLVQRGDLVEANSKLTASNSVAEIGGPGLGGVLVGAISAPLVIAANAISFLASALTLGTIRCAEPDPSRHPATGGLADRLARDFAKPSTTAICVPSPARRRPTTSRGTP